MTDKPKRTNRPSIKERAAERTCCNCGKPIEGGRANKMYCSGPGKRSSCAIEAQNRAVARGAAIVRWAQAWRIDRGSGEIAKGSLDQLCNIVDSFNAEDLAAKRPRADLWASKLLASGSLYIDRRGK